MDGYGEHGNSDPDEGSLSMVQQIAIIITISVAILARAILSHSALHCSSALLSRSNSHGDEARGEGDRKEGRHGGDEGDEGHEDEESEESDGAEGDEAHGGVSSGSLRCFFCLRNSGTGGPGFRHHDP